ncbi:E3 ubiquitin-protein ligase DTX3L [Sebastes umbrosus]|uniref:E3 ubiquitin-protein ligase DTX3L n=1 Tax=Sebastes umbrosus TaxID=72105 RepID=UPI00189E5DAA|nr:E3 ubiquitin-protein ligase DTX3L [Sebastes umbrosus]
MNLKVKAATSSLSFRLCCSERRQHAAAPALEELCRMEFITDITVTIVEADYKDLRKLKKILQSYSPEKKALSYRVKGTYEELEKLSVQLSAARHHSSPVTHGPTSQPDGHASPRVKPVDVSGVFMAYIEQTCARELKKILGNSFAIETQPDTAHNKPSGTVRVTFRPRHVSSYSVRADFVRQRFITFYQRAASDLQVISVPLSSHDHKDLQQRFPHLLFKPSLNRREVTVTGPFVHIAKFKEFLSQNTPSSSKSPVNKGPADTPSSRTSGPSPTRSKDPEEEESCAICMEPIVTWEKETLRCKHSFCKSCLQQAFKYKPVCPTCGALYGVLTGTQPDGGEMKVTQIPSSLPGYDKYGTIKIHYYIPSGIQKEEHQNPGQPYEGASRTGYLPDSSEGRSIVKLLKRAFNQRLVFTVGRSTTSGMNNMVTWNDIHHKTSTHGGPTNYGYPDPDYLRRVRDELKAKGIE